MSMQSYHAVTSSKTLCDWLGSSHWKMWISNLYFKKKKHCLFVLQFNCVCVKCTRLNQTLVEFSSLFNRPCLGHVSLSLLIQWFIISSHWKIVAVVAVLRFMLSFSGVVEPCWDLFTSAALQRWSCLPPSPSGRQRCDLHLHADWVACGGYFMVNTPNDRFLSKAVYTIEGQKGKTYWDCMLSRFSKQL